MILAAAAEKALNRWIRVEKRPGSQFRISPILEENIIFDKKMSLFHTLISLQVSADHFSSRVPGWRGGGTREEMGHPVTSEISVWNNVLLFISKMM